MSRIEIRSTLFHFDFCSLDARSGMGCLQMPWCTHSKCSVCLLGVYDIIIYGYEADGDVRDCLQLCFSGTHHSNSARLPLSQQTALCSRVARLSRSTCLPQADLVSRKVVETGAVCSDVIVVALCRRPASSRERSELAVGSGVCGNYHFLSGWQTLCARIRNRGACSN